MNQIIEPWKAECRSYASVSKVGATCDGGFEAHEGHTIWNLCPFCWLRLLLASPQWFLLETCWRHDKERCSDEVICGEVSDTECSENTGSFSGRGDNVNAALC